MKLFEDIERISLDPARHNETNFDYYNRSARKDISIIRNKLNQWFLEYPENEKKEFKASFIKHFDDCFFELFLYQLFNNLGFEVLIHPELPNSPKRPDFLIKKGSLEIYVEAKIVKDKSHVQEAVERKINNFYDDLSKLKLKGFLLNLDTLNFKTTKQPSAKPLIKYISQEINKIDPDGLTHEIEKYGIDRIPIIEFENEDVHLIVKPIPLVPSAKVKENTRPIGIYPSEIFYGGCEDAIRASVDLKAKRYGELDKPFIVCINTLDYKSSAIDDIENAIWGSEAISWSENPNNRDTKLIRKRNGVFLHDSGPRLKNLSGVFVTRVFPHIIPDANYWLFNHPFAKNEIDFKNIGLCYSYVENGNIITNTGNDFDKILQISKDWLSE
ncbi:hypothetical protein BZG01_17430 [Labilibaculum manganireducens]|uniref:Restriction endonuclease n=1 Tax=Labilibaculum manganireducens TaxID=1940525 RepID=A0A2N3HWG3_9BACT|nr:hypothetical protein [Labilibaculum manganireducens]PKQ62415.1 hypothetical protein BZG01_17430 [Labilibaculum manganireducens]